MALKISSFSKWHASLKKITRKRNVMFTAAYKTSVINLWVNTFPVLATQQHVAAAEDVKDLPAFVTRNSGWLRSYQSWSKKRNQKAAANVCITRFNRTAGMHSYRTTPAC